MAKGYNLYLQNASAIQFVALPRQRLGLPLIPMVETWRIRAKNRMARLHITQEQLKKPLGVKTRGAIGHYLNGRRDPSPEQFRALADALQTSTDWLLNGDYSLRAAEPEPNYRHDNNQLAGAIAAVEKLMDSLKSLQKTHRKKSRIV
jgi:transcriptional regulator with XRE-family HTH domain